MDVCRMDRTVQELRELRRAAKELEKEIGEKEEAIKKEMTDLGVDILEGAGWRITWKAVASSRVDTAALKKELPEIAARFIRQSTVRRFLLT